MKIAVGSGNPVKIRASLSAFRAVWPDRDWETDGIDVPSGVSSQPLSSTESITGARNRAKAALEQGNADYGVGLEGGMQEIDGRWYDCGWIVVRDRNGVEGIGTTIWMETPPKLLEYIRQGKELGDVIDIVFNKVNAKQNEGHFGLMTGGVITREAGYRDGVVSALTRFLQPDLF